MNTRPAPIPLRPDPLARRDAAMASLARAAIAIGLAALDKSARPIEHASRRGWSDDRGLELCLRAAVTPTTLASAPQLTQVAVAFLETLVPVSAGADLLARGIGLNFNGAAQISVPGIAVPTADFVGEGLPIPVVTAATSAGPVLSPHKLAVITTLTGEMLRNTNAETLVRQVLVEATGPAVDKVLFSTAAAGPDRPAGLMNGVAPLGAAAAAADKSQAVVDDLQLLATAIAPVSGNGQIVLVGSPDVVVGLALRMPRRLDWPVLMTTALAPRTVVAVAANAIVSAIEGVPVIDANSQATFVRDTVPGEIVTADGTVATSVGSLFQTDQVGLRLRWLISWALRSSAALAWMTGVNW